MKEIEWLIKILNNLFESSVDISIYLIILYKFVKTLQINEPENKKSKT
jgi:hypothetical protein